MTSLHHMTHAVSLVIIAILVKKYTDLRHLHNSLRLEHHQLKLTCLPPFSAGTSKGKEFGPHSSPPLSGHLLSEVKGQFQSSVGSNQQFHTKPDSDMLIISSAGDVNVDDDDDVIDDFGRSVKEETGDTGFAGKRDNSVTSFLQPLALLPPRPPDLQLSLRTSYVDSDTFHQSSTEVESGREPQDPLTTDVLATAASASLQQTRESLEKVNPSKSSVLKPRDEVKSKVGGQNEHTPPFADDREGGNNYYLGSLQGLQDDEGEVNVIVTRAGNALDSDDYIYPQSVNVSPIDDALGDYEEWEEYEEEEGPEDKLHPDYGNVSLIWLTDHEAENLSLHGSSVRCSGETVSDRMCYFNNLCFNPKTAEFVFLLSPRSKQENVPHLGDTEAVLELSTVAGHNRQYFYYTVIPSSALSSIQVAVIPRTTIVFKRFKPDNIMHVFHDDIIPLINTLYDLQLGSSRNNETDGRKTKYHVSLFLFDENVEGELYELYRSVSAEQVFTLNSLIATVSNVTDQQSLVCFSEAHVGLSKVTTWYQYGFFEPQGPIPHSTVNSSHIHTASSYLMNTLGLECPLCSEGGHLVLISRKQTRQILNEMDLILAISKRFKLKVMTVGLETHRLEDIIPIIHTARGLVGMHGSLLSLAIFLRQGSIVIELFPYAVNPDHYTPYKSLCSLPGMQITYRAWVNQDKAKSTAHPDWIPELGGIHHLPATQWREIEAQREVPRHLCCEDPSWLYHIFQDTHVNIPEVLDLISNALQEARPLWTHAKSSYSSHLLPGPVQNFRCRVERSVIDVSKTHAHARSVGQNTQVKPSESRSQTTSQRVQIGLLQESKQFHSQGEEVRLHLDWTPPWDVDLFKEKKFAYSVLVQDVNSGKLFPFSADGASVTSYTVIEAGLKGSGQYRVWVKCVVDGTQCPFAGFAECS